jgi:predicted ATPase/class 3 adenylate cyclase
MLTFLFTDLEDSTHLWEQFPEEMQPALAQHDNLLKNAVDRHRGQIVKTTGDGLHAAFEKPADALAAAFAAQQALQAGTWPAATGPLKVRMGLHSGVSQARSGDYYGPEVNLAARVMSLGSGGQVLLSGVTASLVRKSLPEGCSLADLGEHRLKGIAAPEHIFQLNHPALPAEFPPLKSLSAFKHNLQRQLSRFIGREKELAQARSLLQGTRLLTLLGPGGTGKTRLMLQTAEEVIEDFPHGVWLVELAPLTDPGMIPERVAEALNVQEQPGRPILSTLVDYLRPKTLLLLLDNVEHIVQASAEFAEQLLQECPSLKILATGREALFISGEITVQVPSLAVPDSQAGAAHIADAESVQLFIERSRAVRPDFQLTEANAPVIADVVQRLDGIPLALELAAARLRMLTIEQIRARLSDRFRLLTGGRRTALPRQQTLEALIDWSWQLLDEPERILLRRLSVFSGGWDLEAAQAVTGFEPLDEFEVFDYLEQLINKSLVKVDHPPSGAARYGLLESIRQFAQARLLAAGEGEALRERYTQYFIDFALEAEKHMSAATMLPWVDRVVQELDNLRAVIAWNQEEHPEITLRISGALTIKWSYWIHPSEARSWLAASIARCRELLGTEDSPVVFGDFLKALLARGLVEALLGNVKAGFASLEEVLQLAEDEAYLAHYAQGVTLLTSMRVQHWYPLTKEWIEHTEATLQRAREAGLAEQVNLLEMVLFSLHMRKRQFEQALPYLPALEAYQERVGNPRYLGILLLVKARLAEARSDGPAAEQHYAEAISAFEAINDQRLALLSRSDLAHLARRSGRSADALAIYRETILRWQEQGNPIAIAHQLECFAFIAIENSEFEQAAHLIGAASHTRSRLDTPTTNPQEVAELEEAAARLAAALGAAERDRLLEAGGRLSLDEAVQRALHRTSSP